tara:strand:- start:352 stop:687 length:336 start_codon:yes stop_codon:yes gene_type:complete
MIIESKLSNTGKYFNLVKLRYETYMKTAFPSLNIGKVEMVKGRKYTKIIIENAVHSFIDNTNGNILKPNSYRAPHKTPRGNIMTEEQQLESFGSNNPKSNGYYWIKYLHRG